MITLYSTGCPKCKVLKTKLNKKDLQFVEVTDVKEMEKLGFKAAPMLEVNGKIMNYSEAIKWVNNF